MEAIRKSLHRHEMSRSSQNLKASAWLKRWRYLASETPIQGPPNSWTTSITQGLLVPTHPSILLEEAEGSKQLNHGNDLTSTLVGPSLFEEDDSDSDDDSEPTYMRRMLEAPSSWIIDRTALSDFVSTDSDTVSIPRMSMTLDSTTPSIMSWPLNPNFMISKQDTSIASKQDMFSSSRSTIDLNDTHMIEDEEDSAEISVETMNQVRRMIGSGVPIPVHLLHIYKKAVYELYKQSTDSFINSIQALVPACIFNQEDRVVGVHALIKAADYIAHQDLTVAESLIRDLDLAIRYRELMARIFEDKDEGHQRMISILIYCKDILSPCVSTANN